VKNPRCRPLGLRIVWWGVQHIGATIEEAELQGARLPLLSQAAFA
jgi:hypothetical protein